MSNNEAYIFRQCITLRNGQRICKPHGQAFKIPLREKPAPKTAPDNDN